MPNTLRGNWTRTPRLTKADLYQNAVDRKAAREYVATMLREPQELPAPPHAGRGTPARRHRSRKWRTPRALVTGWPIKSIYKRPFKLIRA